MKQPCSILGICIPTYNRADLLKQNLDHLYPFVKELNIPVYISDNASSDDTPVIVQKFKERYPFVYYSRNNENLGPDKNFQKALLMCESEYAWLLGDDDTVTRSLSELCKKLSSAKYDALVFYGAKDHKDHVFTEKDEILIKLAGSMTWMSGLIINRDLISVMNFDRYCGSKFVHTGALLEALCYKDNVSVYAHDFSNANRLVDPLIKYHSGYAENEFLYFTDKWMSMICSLPHQFSYESKLKAIENLPTAPFRSITLIMFRSWRVFSYKELKKQKRIVMSIGHRYYFRFLAIALMPVWLAKVVVALGKYVRKKLYGF